MKLYRFILIFFSLAVLYSCEKDNYFVPKETIVNPNVPISFSQDIQPIFDLSCSISGCHDGQNDDPDLTVGNAYASLFSTGDIDTVTAENSKLYKRVAGVSGALMPPTANGGPLPANKVSLILNWIKQGAKDN